MKWSIQELTHRIRRLGATEAHQQPQNNIKIVSRRETLSEDAERQAGRAGQNFFPRQGGSTTAQPAGIEDVFCATATTTTATHVPAVSTRSRDVGPESSPNNCPLLRRSQTLGNVSSEAHRGTADCATGATSRTPGQPPSKRLPLRRATSGTDDEGFSAAHVVRTEQRRGLLEPSTEIKPSTLPMIRPATADSTGTLRHDWTTKTDRQPPSSTTLAAVGTTWPLISLQDAGGAEYGRTRIRRRNSLPSIPHPPTASAALARGRDRDRNKRRADNGSSASRDDDPIPRGENGVVLRPKPRPKSLGVRSSSSSSAPCYEALRAQKELGREGAGRKPRPREDSDGGSDTSAARGRSGESHQRRTLNRSRSAQQIEKTPQGETGEKGQAKRAVEPPSTVEAPGELRRSSSFGSALPLPVPPQAHDRGGNGYMRQHRHRTRPRKSEFILTGATVEGEEKQERIDIRAASTGGGDDLPAVAKRTSTSSHAKSRGRGRSRSRARPLEREDREKIEQTVATPADTAADGAAASATLAAAEATAAAARAAAAAAADEAMETAKGRAASAADVGAAVVTAGIRRNGSLSDLPTVETHPGTDEAYPLASSSVWVTRCLDYQSTDGLVFLLSDGSVGVLFKDNTKMVVAHAGQTFDYIEPVARTTAPGPSPTSSIHEAELGAGGGRPRTSPDVDASDNNLTRRHRYYRYSLGSFPFFLRKKVLVLKYVREMLYLEYGGDLEGSGSTTAAAGQRRREPLTFVEKWQRAGDTHCFRLSHQVVQVMFSDGTEVLLSSDRQVITFVSEDGKREIQPRRTMESRMEVMKRIRCAEDFIFIMRESP